MDSADDLGVDAVFTGESASSNLFIDLTWAAARTSQVSLGAGIVNVYARSPSLVALNIAQLDAISDGRFILGLGSSTPPLVEGLHGIPFDRPISRIAEYIDIIRTGWSGEQLNYDGDFYSPSGGRLRETPVQNDPPIAVASLGPTNRRLTGEKADIWLPHLVPKSAFSDLAADVYDAARDAGRSANDVDVYAYVPMAVADDVAIARDRVRSHVAAYAGSAVPYRDIIARAGYDTVAESVHEEWQDGVREAARDHVSDELVDDIGIAATPETAMGAVSQWYNVGVDMVVMNFPPGTHVEDINTALDAVT